MYVKAVGNQVVFRNGSRERFMSLAQAVLVAEPLGAGHIVTKAWAMQGKEIPVHAGDTHRPRNGRITSVLL